MLKENLRKKFYVKRKFNLNLHFATICKISLFLLKPEILRIL